MHLSDFEYDLPAELIAQHPLPVRDASRLMVVDRRQRTVRHLGFLALPELLEPGDHLIVNDTRVVPARLLGRREGGTGEVELLLTHPVGDPDAAAPTEGAGVDYEALVRPARKLPQGASVRVGTSEIPVEIVDVLDDKRRRVRFPPGFRLLEFLEQEGHVPLPPYIRRPDGPEDHARYQTVFAREGGAVAAPTAGLHFTPAVLAALEERGIRTSCITLHVGPGTFAPITVEDPTQHAMEKEFYRVLPETAAEIAATRARGGRLVAVGTTVVRTLETAAIPAGEGETGSPSSREESRGGDSSSPGDPWTLRPGSGWTQAFIHPPYAFHMVDVLLTNFHLPRSTLLMLVSAFAGVDLVREAYRQAVAERYRFYSYGDAMLIL